MRIHCLTHVDFEGVANIGEWAVEREHSLSATPFYLNATLPETAAFDWLLIMGGPMSVHDESSHPWLIEEKRFIEKTIQDDKVVIGICLGAQLIAEVLGARVYSNSEKEIGFFPVHPTAHGKPLLPDGSGPFDAFHWHGETFNIPSEASNIACTEACPNQGFVWSHRVYAFQFHLESSATSIEALIENCSRELVEGKYIQKAEKMREEFFRLKVMKKQLFEMLDRIEKQTKKEP